MTGISLIKSTIKRSRLFNGFINIAFNHYDEKRVAQIGPNAAAAEWIVKNEGLVKDNRESAMWIKDFNSISPCYGPKFKLAYVEAIGIDITSGGCRHFDGITHLKFINLRNCVNIDDSGLQLIYKNSWNTLQYLDIAGTSISTEGLDFAAGFKKLEVLKYDHRLSSNIEKHALFKDRLKKVNSSLSIEMVRN